MIAFTRKLTRQNATGSAGTAVNLSPGGTRMVFVSQAAEELSSRNPALDKPNSLSARSVSDTERITAISGQSLPFFPLGRK
jgi:hypothetical protein